MTTATVPRNPPGRNIKAVLFDLDDTLIDHDSAVAGALSAFRALHLPGMPIASLQTAWETAASLHFPRFVNGQISFPDQRRLRIRDVLGIPALTDAEADVLFDAYLGAYEPLCAPFADVLPCLAALPGLAMGIISNGETGQQWRKLRRSGLLSHFGTVLISEETGLRKPDRRAFELAARNLKVTPSECAFVGDNPDADYRGSEEAGMFPILIDRKGKASGRGLRAVTSLREVPELLGLLPTEPPARS
jgi:putative hydrolase of the HAD superfamily